MLEKLADSGNLKVFYPVWRLFVTKITYYLLSSKRKVLASSNSKKNLLRDKSEVLLFDIQNIKVDNLSIWAVAFF